MDVTVYPCELRGSITAPPSKSAAHRAVIAAALAEGNSVIRGADLSSDINATIKACEALGCGISIEPSERYNTLYIKGGLKETARARIDCAESGSTLRFMIPIACTLGGEKIFEGSGRLPYRPIDEYIRIFDKQRIKYKKPGDKNLPLIVEGKLSYGEYAIDGNVSSQYITGLLLALPLLDGSSKITVSGTLESKGYVDMTLDTLSKSGVSIKQKDNCFFIDGNQRYSPRSVTVEGDYSQAAFFIAGAALAGDTTIDGLDPCSLQPDRAIVDIMRRMGADITQTGNLLTVRQSKLRGIDVDVSQCPDLVPPIAAAAAMAEGTTRITGAARLRIKESDRLRSMSANLNSIGIETEELDDALIIHGGRVREGTVDSFGDHRIPMAFAILAAGSAALTIRGAQCVSKSYPSFFEDLKSLGGSVI